MSLENSYFSSLPKVIQQLPRLQSLNFQYNSLTDLNATTLAFFQQLTTCKYTYYRKDTRKDRPAVYIQHIWMDAGQVTFTEDEYVDENLSNPTDTIRKYCHVCMPWIRISRLEYTLANSYFNQQYTVEETARRWYTEVPETKRNALIEEQELAKKKVQAEKEATNRMRYYLHSQQPDKQYTDQELLEQWNHLSPEEQVLVQHHVRNMKKQARKKAVQERKKKKMYTHSRK